MLGCFGTAPPRGQFIASNTAGCYGGNMDYRGFRARTTVYLPIFVAGALFHLGDIHALQGDGEIVEQALQGATTEMVRWLIELGLEERQAHILLGECVRYQVGNVFDPAYTMICRLSKNLLESVGLEF